jgi:DNA replication protein DnaC
MPAEAGRGAAHKQAAGTDRACPHERCDGSGWIVASDNTATPCTCRGLRVRNAHSRRLGSGIPRRFRGVSFERKPICDMDPMLLREVRDFVRRIEEHLDSGRGLWFQGDVGTGKTSLAMLVSRSALELGRSVAIYSIPRLLSDIKATYEDAGGSSYGELFRRLCEVDLLHLDDLGAERKTEWVLEQLYAIVNERWQDQRSIVVTTNITDLGELREQVGPRTVSRLAEICGEPIPIMGPDRRLAPSA